MTDNEVVLRSTSVEGTDDMGFVRSVGVGRPNVMELEVPVRVVISVVRSVGAIPPESAVVVPETFAAVTLLGVPVALEVALSVVVGVSIAREVVLSAVVSAEVIAAVDFSGFSGVAVFVSVCV